ncbi:restriction endonuclease subunit S [Bacillus siamensis]|uniref:restriction endonuclease subunit S n=1 Tax=Bacillus siamensis TaxID=659243 RepID=UPI0021086A07|nr:restriction endonuclease subunit S [Bacillus siamensis]UUA83123.1 restriction endonuclease subunit S [Bacillus siamensis]
MSKKKKTIEELLEEALVPKEEQTYEVPENWVYFKFTSIFDVQGGTQPPKSQFVDEEREGYVRLVQIRDFSSDKYKTYIPNTQKLRKMKEEDILIARYGASIGRILTGLSGAYNVALAKVVYPKGKVDKKFLFWLLKSEHFQIPLMGISRSAQSGFNKNDLSYFKMPLPPLNEQKRIAEKVERLLSKIEEAKQLIEEAKETFELRRAAILDKAFRGELTRKWRGENADITTANEWIEQINLLKEGTKTKYKDQLDSSILEKLYKLPKEWKWVHLNDLIEASTYGTSAKTNDDVTGTPVLRMGNIVDGYLELNNLKYLPNNHEDVLKYDLQTNDLLFNRTNSYELVGKTSVITEDVSERFTFASYLIRVRLFYKDFLASYVSHYINSHVGRKILLSMVTQQVGQANINSQKLASLPIPLPSQEEVMEITNWLNNYRELESKQKEMILVEENIEALKQSILSKAFRGELGTNDPGEESAIELLKEVLQEQVK